MDIINCIKNNTVYEIYYSHLTPSSVVNYRLSATTRSSIVFTAGKNL